MRELHGVWIPENGTSPNIKALGLLFDRLHVLDLDMLEYMAPRNQQLSPMRATDIAFLRKRGFFKECWFPFRADFRLESSSRSYIEYLMERIADLGYSYGGKEQIIDMVNSSERRGVRVLTDIMAYFIAAELNEAHHTVPVCRTRFPMLRATSPSQTPQTLLRVAASALPAPDGSCAWQDIFDFKAEMQDQQWGFRRFLQTLATKRQTEAEIRDEIEWMVNEYGKSMKIHNIKASQSFVEVFVVSPLEIIENLVKFNWSKIAKGVLSVRRRKVELMEAEMKAPGRECAYVFDARKRFPTNE